MPELLALLIGYLLGSVLPAEIFGRAHGVDIRASGTRNPGATNALRQLGWLPGLITGFYDSCVGLVSMYIASQLGLSTGWTYLAGIAAIVGHCFPLFSRFRGGQGMAATTGLLVYQIAIGISRGWIALSGLALIALSAVAVFVLTRSATMVGVMTVPALVLQVVVASADWQYTLFMTALAGFIWLVQLSIARSKDLFRLAEPVHSWLAHTRALLR